VPGEGYPVNTTQKVKETTTTTWEVNYKRLRIDEAPCTGTTMNLWAATCFVPDVEGTYMLALRVTGSCKPQIMYTTINAACDAPNYQVVWSETNVTDPELKPVSSDAGIVSPILSSLSLRVSAAGNRPRSIVWHAEYQHAPDAGRIGLNCWTTDSGARDRPDVIDQYHTASSIVFYCSGVWIVKATVTDGCSTTFLTRTITVKCPTAVAALHGLQSSTMAALQPLAAGSLALYGAVEVAPVAQSAIRSLEAARCLGKWKWGVAGFDDLADAERFTLPTSKAARTLSAPGLLDQSHGAGQIGVFFIVISIAAVLSLVGLIAGFIYHSRAAARVGQAQQQVAAGTTTPAKELTTTSVTVEPPSADGKYNDVTPQV